MKAVYLIIFLFGFKTTYAHSPDLSSLMIYEQNGKSLLVIKSSLTAFEGEVDYLFGKGAYKTADEFNQLVIQHFGNNCVVIMNGDSIKFSNVQIQLGHETTLFAELINVPEKISTLYVSYNMFKDMPNNMGELILTDLRGVSQKQYILNKENKHQVAFKVANEKWVVTRLATPFGLNSLLLAGAAVLLTGTLIAILLTRRKYSSAKPETSFTPILAGEKIG